MRPVRTASSNFTWLGTDPEMGDLSARVERVDGVLTSTSVWEPTEDERHAIAAGGNVALRVLGVHPPVMVFVTEEQRLPERPVVAREET